MEDHKTIEQLIKENKELKKQLENSVVLPCKIGDMVYAKRRSRKSGFPAPGLVEAIIINENSEIIVKLGGYMGTHVWGKTVFLTYEEAEKALELKIEGDKR